MRKALILLWLALPAMSFGQSTLNFPTGLAPEVLGSTGFAVVNPGSAEAAVTFTLRNTVGAPIATANQSLAGGGQLAVLASQLFGTTTQAGWVQVTSPTTGLTGFFLTGDFSTFTDGADPARTSENIVLPIVAPNTVINVANSSLTPATITFSLRQADGTELVGSSTVAIAARGLFQSAASTVFPGADLSQATHIRVTGGFSISASAVVTDFLVAPSTGVMNGVPASGTTTELNFGHVISGAGGGGNWLTTIGVTNLTSSSNAVSITFTPCPASGTCPGSPTTVQRVLPSNGALRESADTLFGFSAGTYQDGWIRVTGSLPLTGFVAYADTAARGMAIVPGQSAPLTEMIFGHVAQATGWLTGVALLNTSNVTANVEIYAMNPDGTLIGGALDSPAAAFTLAPGAKIANLLGNPWIPNATTNGGFVYVRTTNAVPLYGIELFFLTNLALLSNVAPGAIADGITYTPPPPVGTITLTSISPTTIARGDELTLLGNGFSDGDAVVFTAGSGSVNVAATFDSATQLRVNVPATATTGPVVVQSSIATSDPQILEVSGTDSTPVQTMVTVSAGQTTTGLDIYVPVPAGSLNLTGVGAGDRFEGISSAASTTDLGRGQTTDLIIVGNGIGSSSVPSISGTGVTLTDITLGGGAMFVEVTVAPTAALGLRTLIMTNSNGDTSVLSGGINITN